jgi:UDP-N-acetylglucosamine 4,6-dehydratase/5-epimerase
MFKNKTLLITGGTGSFGNALLQRFLNSELSEIRIYSRDEKKQDDMRKLYNNPKIKFYLGDVRDLRSILTASSGVDYIFHAAALKQVPSCEFYPLEAVKTNILGTENVLEAAIMSSVERVVCLSTDKAVYPVNAMGISKAMMEKVALAKSRGVKNPVINVVRYGNVMGSRGSVIPLFINQILSGMPISITDPRMTRFMMSLDDAVDLVMHAFKNGGPGDIFVQKAPSVTIEILAKSIAKILGKPDHPIEIIGTRHGEKLFETLLSREEYLNAKESNQYFHITPDLRDLNYGKYIEQGDTKISTIEDFNSHNCDCLTLDRMTKLLSRLPCMQVQTKGDSILLDI